MNSKHENIRDLHRGINDFKRGYQPSSNLVKDENGDLLADSHNILNRWRNYFSQLLNVHSVSDVRQTEIHTALRLVPDLGPFEFESAIAKLKRYKSPGSDQIPVELIQAGGEILRSKIHNLITSIWHKEEFPDQWKESIIVPVHKKGDKIDCNNCQGISLPSTSYKIVSKILSRLSKYIDEILRIISVDFDATDQLQIRFLHSLDTGEKMGVHSDKYISYS
ncbi:hypothetical protein B7P43_G06731 [Cryptotermes secundus]|uniref:Uncharacterized protein n=1 Tax=Cryptotermes secundus TaxID=105785 RepID=A0A2J7QZ64_9NEOP|nr:hypothetical protein B7P43_G06731 [Cryptotermes secundus]